MKLLHVGTLVFALVWVGSSSLAPPCAAHELSTATARITLRDGHVELLVDVDLLLLMAYQAEHVASAAEPELAAMIVAVHDIMTRQTKLTVDGANVELALRGLPSTTELRAIGATLSMTHRDHGELVRLRFEARGPTAAPQNLTLLLPPALGQVMISLVQPTTRYVAPGVPASFELRGPSRSPHAGVGRVASPMTCSTFTRWAWLVIGLLGLAGCITMFRRRSGDKTVAAATQLASL